MSKRSRIVLIAIDAADKDLILQWADAGVLPTFRRLLKDAAWGITDSPHGLFVGAVWPTFWTGVSPATHARYCYEQLIPGTYETRKIKASDIQVDPFWKAIGDNGKRVVVLDIPKTHPTKGLNGVHVVDWGTHDPEFDHVATIPEGLAQEIEKRFGSDTIGNCNAYSASPEALVELRDALLHRIEKKTKLIEYFMEREDWDCFLAGFSDAHCVGHQCWHLHDESHIKYDAELCARIGDPVKDVYVAIDRAIARLMEVVPDDAEFVVWASHGFRSHYDATFMLDDILKRVEKPRAVQSGDNTMSFAKRAWMLLPAGIRSRLKPLKTAAKVGLGLDPRATRRYFAVPNNDAYGGVRINLVGREPDGKVSPDDYDATCDFVAESLLALVNTETNEPLVHNVTRSSDFYRGTQMHHLPDLLVDWNHDSPVSTVSSPRTGVIVGTYKKGRTGDHNPHGIVFFHGGGAAGPIGEKINVMDIAPTIAERIGVELTGVEGKSFASSLGPPNL